MGIAKFEFSEDYEFVVMNKDENNGFLEVKHIFKKKEPVKDFDWYVMQYSKTLNRISNKPFDHLFTLRSLRGYSDIPFEFKIGLFVFICDDLNINWVKCLSHTAGSGKQLYDRLGIIPCKFMDSLFNDSRRNG